jgi:hypothetical protein
MVRPAVLLGTGEVVQITWPDPAVGSRNADCPLHSTCVLFLGHQQAAGNGRAGGLGVVVVGRVSASH